MVEIPFLGLLYFLSLASLAKILFFFTFLSHFSPFFLHSNPPDVIWTEIWKYHVYAGDSFPTFAKFPTKNIDVN